MTYWLKSSAGLTRAAILSMVSVAALPALAGGLLAYEVGTEDMGLASAGMAVRAADASTVFSNPAGMTHLEGDQFVVGSQLLYTNTRFSPEPGISPRLGTGDGGRAGGLNGFFPGGGLFYSHSVSPDVKLGFAATGNFGAKLKFDDNWVGRYYGKESTLVGVSFLPSAALRVNEQLSVGASVNIMRGYLKSVTAVNNVAPGLADGQLKVSDSAWGIGGTLGMQYQATPDTRVGLTYSLPIKLNFESPAEFSGVGPGLSAVLGARGLLNANVKLGVTVPQSLMFSAMHQLNSRWTLLGNVGWQQWSKFGKVDVGIDSNNPNNITTNVDFKDTWHTAVGAQYQLDGKTRLNFGVAYDSKFQSGNYVSPLLPANAAWRFGTGLRQQVSKSFSWGVAAEYLYGGTLDVNKQASIPVALGGRGNLVGSYKNLGTIFTSATFDWKF